MCVRLPQLGGFEVQLMFNDGIHIFERTLRTKLEENENRSQKQKTAKKTSFFAKFTPNRKIPRSPSYAEVLKPKLSVEHEFDHLETLFSNESSLLATPRPDASDSITFRTIPARPVVIPEIFVTAHAKVRNKLEKALHEYSILCIQPKKQNSARLDNDKIVNEAKSMVTRNSSTYDTGRLKKYHANLPFFSLSNRHSKLVFFTDAYPHRTLWTNGKKAYT